MRHDDKHGLSGLVAKDVDIALIHGAPANCGERQALPTAAACSPGRTRIMSAYQRSVSAVGGGDAKHVFGKSGILDDKPLYEAGRKLKDPGVIHSVDRYR